MNIYQPVISGSLTVTGSTTFFGNITINSGSLTMTSGSLTGTASFSTSASYAYTASSATSASYVLNAVSSSYAFTASSATNSTSASKAVSSSYSDTASFSNNFTVLGNLTVYGTQSVQYITSSQLNVANNVITVNVGTPGVRFGGLSVYDSGSTAGTTGSLFWDSQNNNWIYQQVTGSTYTGGMLISGPRNTGGLGNEQGTTSGSLMKGQGGDHMTSSAIFEDGYKATFYGTSLMVSSSGLVGIGETSPASKLSIGGIQGSTIASNVALLVGNNGAAGTVGNLIQIGLHYNPAGATPASIIGANFTSTTGYTKSDIFFATRDVTTDTAPTERLRITSDGKVGIGTTVPGMPLEVYVPDGNGIRLKNSGSADKRWDLALSGNNFVINETGVGARFYISSSGFIGLGNSAPQANIHIGASLNSVPASTSIAVAGDTSIRFTGGSDGNANYGSYIAGTQFGGVRALQLGSRQGAGDVLGMTITQGNVGVGTTAPATPLDVFVTRTSGGQVVALTLTDGVTGAQTDGGYKAIRSSSNNASSRSEIRFVEDGGTNNDTAIAFATQMNASTLLEKMRISRAGYVTKPYQPFFQAYSTGGSWTTGQTVVYAATLNNVGSGYSTSTGRFTAPVTGVYLFRADFRAPSVGSNILDIKTSTGLTTRHEENATYGNNFHQTMAAIYMLAAGDYVYCYVGGGTIQPDGNSIDRFEGYLLG